MESSDHTIWWCEWAAVVWNISKVAFMYDKRKRMKLIDALWVVADSGNRHCLSLMVVMAWKLWFDRNKGVNGDGRNQPKITKV